MTKKQSWLDFAAPASIKAAIANTAKRLNTTDDIIREVLDKIAPPHVVVEMNPVRVADEIIKTFTLRKILENVEQLAAFQEYEINQPDDMDESGSGGLWDMAGDLAFDFCPTGFTDCDGRNLDAEAAQLQELLYNLLSSYRVEIGGGRK